MAAQASPRTKTRSAQPEEVAAWVAQLPAKEKDDLLLRLMAGEDAALGAEIRARFNHSRVESSPAPEVPCRTVGELLAAAEAFRSKRQRKEARRAAEEKDRAERLAAIARQKHLDALKGREPELWAEVEQLVATKLAKSYDLAVQHLVDLRDLAVREGEEEKFSRRLARLREAHARKPALIGRLQERGLSS